MLGTSKKGKNPKFKYLKFLKNLEIRSLESYFMLEANKVSVWSLEFFFFSPVRICENFLLKISTSGA